MTRYALPAVDQLATYGQAALHPDTLDELVDLGWAVQVRPCVGRITPAGLLAASRIEGEAS